jgi:hypothetical protein
LSTAAGGSSFQIGIELMCGSNFTLGPLHLFLFSCLSVPDLAAIWLWDARSCTSIITQLLPTTDPTLNQQLSVSAQFGTLNALVRVNIKTSLPSTVWVGNWKGEDWDGTHPYWKQGNDTS